jgi:hypothetical protein
MVAENIPTLRLTPPYYTRYLPFPDTPVLMLSLLLPPGTSPEAFVNSVMENIPETIFLAISINLSITVGGYLSNFIWGHLDDSDEEHTQRLGPNNHPRQPHRTLGRENDQTWKTRAIITLLLFTFSWRQPELLAPFQRCLRECQTQTLGLPDTLSPPSFAPNLPRPSTTGRDPSVQYSALQLPDQ